MSEPTGTQTYETNESQRPPLHMYSSLSEKKCVRRADLATRLGKGFSLAECVHDMTRDYKVTRQTIYNDYEYLVKMYKLQRATKDGMFKYFNRYETLYKEALFCYTQCSHYDTSKAGFLNAAVKILDSILALDSAVVGSGAEREPVRIVFGDTPIPKSYDTAEEQST